MNKDVLDTLRDYKDKCKELENINDKLSNSLLSEENKIDKYKEVIDKAIKLIEDTYYSKNTTDIDSIVLSGDKLIKVREILKEVE